jgi:hypothetical protein
MEEKSYDELIHDGKKSLIEKYGYTNENIGSFNGNMVDKTITGNKPQASIEYVNYIEKSLRSLCSPYEAHIDNMTYDELQAYAWEFLMSLDLERGIVFGQVPHLTFKHSKEFLLWEKQQFDKYEERMNHFNKNQ